MANIDKEVIKGVFIDEKNYSNVMFNPVHWLSSFC